jgi:hypothetical protein|tara:strand:- start:2211 stop:2402 length:192 start_codon:yes stop_codon:yes gene_type:complete
MWYVLYGVRILGVFNDTEAAYKWMDVCLNEYFYPQYTKRDAFKVEFFDVTMQVFIEDLLDEED